MPQLTGGPLRPGTMTILCHAIDRHTGAIQLGRRNVPARRHWSTADGALQCLLYIAYRAAAAAAAALGTDFAPTAVTYVRPACD